MWDRRPRPRRAPAEGAHLRRIQAMKEERPRSRRRGGRARGPSWFGTRRRGRDAAGGGRWRGRGPGPRPRAPSRTRPGRSPAGPGSRARWGPGSRPWATAVEALARALPDPRGQPGVPPRRAPRHRAACGSRGTGPPSSPPCPRPRCGVRRGVRNARACPRPRSPAGPAARTRQITAGAARRRA